MLWLLLIICLLYIVPQILKQYNYWKIREVPHSATWPILGDFAPFYLRRKAFVDVLDKLYYKFQDKRYFGIHLFLTPVLILNDVELIKDITIRNFDSFTDRREIVPHDIDPIFANNLASLKGDDWVDMRRTMSPAFTSVKLRSIFESIKKSADRLINHYENIAKNSSTVASIELSDMFSRYSTEIVATFSIGLETNCLYNGNQFYLSSQEISSFKGIKDLKLILTMLSSSIMKLFNIKLWTHEFIYFKDLVKDAVGNRLSSGTVRPDILHFISENFRSENPNLNTNDKDQLYNIITSQLMILLIAGIDTVTTSLSYAIYYLSLHEDIQRKLQIEIDSALAECGGEITYDKLMEMKYIDMVIRENLRKSPPGPVLERVCTKPFTIKATKPGKVPLHIHKGDIVWVPARAIQNNPAHFPDPDKFDPERFNEENRQKHVPGTYLAFGSGRRNCIGKRLADVEIRLIIFSLLNKFNFFPVEKTSVPIRLCHQQVPATSADGFWVGLKIRK